MEPNLLRVRKTSAARCAEDARWGLAPYGTDPFATILGALDSAWVSGSAARTGFTDDLAGLGTVVADTFTRQGAQYWDEVDDEPVQIDPDDPHQGWKSDLSTIQSRVVVGSQNPYWRR